MKVSALLYEGQENIKVVSEQLHHLLLLISKADPFFSCPVLISELKQDFIIDLSVEKEQALREIAEAVLVISKDDIAKHDKIQDPTIEYSRPFGFSLLVQFQNDQREITFTVKLGSSGSNGLGILSNNGMTLDFNFSFSLLIQIIKSPLVEYALIKITNISYLKKARNYIYPLGLATYFSNKNTFEFPKQLDGIDYERTEYGLLTVLKSDDQKEEELLKIMNEIATRLPGYSKRKLA